MTVQILLLDHILKVSKLMHGTAMSAKPLLEEASRCAPPVQLQKVHRTPFVRSPASNFVNNLTNKLHALSTGLPLLVDDRLLCSGHGVKKARPSRFASGYYNGGRVKSYDSTPSNTCNTFRSQSRKSVPLPRVLGVPRAVTGACPQDFTFTGVLRPR